ncbi:MAG: hypothetical protein AB7V55_08060, partial [Oscillospiraceae bacterium]
MKTKTLPRLVCLVLCLSLVLTACSPADLLPNLFGPGPGSAPTSGAGEETAGRKTIPYDEMVYERPDIEGMKAEVEALTQRIKDADSLAQIMEIDDECDALYKNFYSMRTLAMLKKYHDSKDSYFEEEYRLLDTASVEMSILGNDYNRAIVEGPFAEDYRAEIGDYQYQSIVDGLLLNSREVEDYKKERRQLNTDYNKLLTELTVTYEGTQYSYDDIVAEEDWMLRIELIYAYYGDNAPKFAEMYIRMIELDKLTAAALGFDSPADMYYLSYARDYTPENALQLCNESKRLFGPLMEETSYLYFEAGQVNQRAAENQMESALKKVDPELAEAWAFLQEYGLYDIDPLPGKHSGIAFTTEIYNWDAPFVYAYWNDNFHS